MTFSKTFGAIFALSLSALLAEAGEGRYEVAQFMIPMTITNSGSYLLTGNLTGSAGANGITIAADDVSIDLNGFTMYGVPGSLCGIVVQTETQHNVTVQNGIIRDWGSFGVDLTAGTNGGATNCVLRDLTVYHNGNGGLRGGFNSNIERCRAFQNGGDPGPSPVVTNRLGMGIENENGSAVERCLSWFNNEHGILPHSATAVRSVVTYGNGHDGIHASHATLIRNAIAANSSEGIQVASGGGVVDSVAAYCDEDGIRVEGGQGGSVVEGCVTMGNHDNGIDCQGAGSRVSGANVYSNDNHGLRINVNGAFVQRNLTVGNSAAFSGHSGINISGSSTGVRLEGNHASGQPIGINCATSTVNNFIVKNSAVNNGIKNIDGANGNYMEDPIKKTGGTLPNDPWRNFGP